ncbi:hypothetical protein ODU72_03070 [Lactobacillus amylovorus]|uniref:Uncharacterized protein n=1 Tax=Lactobacillus amylovorus TaxID=1604 RepID=A0A9X4AA88_LACAM|nr:hypothetical protein [Lactobacillus amylovorus]MDB6257667.1 hypothetical protein [Lactobacillus amylovorus]
MKPNTRILDYTTLVQDGVLTLDDVPQDIKAQVTKWVRYLSGVTDNGMVKEDTATKLATTVENKLSATLDNAAKTGLVVGEKDGE